MPLSFSVFRALRQLLADHYPDARPPAERDPDRPAHVVATGIAALDDVLPLGGLPRGQLTAWSPGAGSGALLRSACRAVIVGGGRAAWVDATNMREFYRSAVLGTSSSDASTSPSLVVYPGDRADALRCAELVLRSGAFALAVLEVGSDAAPIDTATVRLVRAARDGRAALVVIAEPGPGAALGVATRLDPRGVRWRHGAFGHFGVTSVLVEVRVRAPGWNRRAVVPLEVAALELRGALAPAPDRRAAAIGRLRSAAILVDGRPARHASGTPLGPLAAYDHGA